MRRSNSIEDVVSTRRGFLRSAALATGTSLVLPTVVACSNGGKLTTARDASSSSTNPSDIPLSRPGDWNPIEFNLKRGLAGAVPTSYHASIAGADGPLLHIGKHILYVAPIEKTLVPAGFIGLMAGEFAKGYTKHGAAATHWYDWISIAVNGSSYSVKSSFASWPTGNYLVMGGGAIADAGGANTVYLAALPGGVGPGDTIRVVGHCNLHGEYVSFITL